ncbi:MAG: hypothetical protein D6743_11295, partial [Calditrichaeota bacterium]
MNVEFKKVLADWPESYTLNIKRALVVTLAFFNLLVYLSPRIEVHPDQKPPPQITITAENIPVTRQIRRTPPPPKPTVPVPSEDESIPEDVTIEETTLKYTNIFADTPDGIQAP